LSILQRLDVVIERLISPVFSPRTISSMRFDVVRFWTRLKRYSDKKIVPSKNKLHFGCGLRRVQGWLNVDVRHSEYDVDLASGRLPWESGVFEAAVGQHVIQHLELTTELMPLLCELHRVLKPGGEIWLSCSDIEKVCRSYIEHNMVDLIQDRKTRYPNFSLENIPTTHMINDLFHIGGTVKNLYDFTLLEWALKEANFTNVERVVEADLLQRFSEFLPRNDDLQTIYVCATVSRSRGIFH